MNRAVVANRTAVAPLFLLALLVACGPCLAAGDAPLLNHGRKWRIGYYD